MLILALFFCITVGISNVNIALDFSDENGKEFGEAGEDFKDVSPSKNAVRFSLW